jgi:hypothetical protein
MLSMVLMWLATISREPGGLAAFAGQIAATERDVRTSLVTVEEAVVREQGRQAAESEARCEAPGGLQNRACSALPSDLDFVD